MICLALFMGGFSIVAAQQRVSTDGGEILNVIYIYADDLGYAEPGSCGQQKIRTPRLDRIAKVRSRFTQHYTGARVCAPARHVMATLAELAGQQAPSNDCLSMNDRLQKQAEKGGQIAAPMLKNGSSLIQSLRANDSFPFSEMGCNSDAWQKVETSQQV